MLQIQFIKEKEFKDTVVGKIPKEWKTVMLSDVCNQRSEIIVPSGDGSTFVGLEHIDSGRTNLKRFSSDGGLKSSKFRFYSGDILYGKLRPYLDKAVLVEFDGICSTDLLVLSANENLAIRDFLIHILHSNRFVSHAVATTGGTNYPRTSWGGIGKFILALPTIVEQEKIVSVISTIDKIIEKTDEIIQKTKNLKKGLLHELFSKGIGHKKLKDTDVGEIPSEWEVKKLEELCKEVTIGVVNPATPYYTTSDDGVPYFRSQNVRENRLEPTNIYVKKEFNEKHRRSILKENDVLTLQTGFIGISCLVPKKFEGSNCHSLLITRTDPKLLNPQFLCHFLNSEGKDTIMRLNAGWGRAHLLLQDFRKLKIPVPSINEQEKIAYSITTVYKKIELEQKEKLRLQTVKVALMDLLLTGKIRVKV